MMERNKLDQIYAHMVDVIEEAVFLSNGADGKLLVLEELNTIGASLGALLAEGSALWQQQLLDRIEIQKLLNNGSLTKSAFTMVWEEQMAFYRAWLQQYEQLLLRPDDPCRIQLTARQLLVLIRLGREAQLLPDVPLKQCLTFVSTHFATQQQGQLSYESLRKKYSDISKKDMEVVGMYLRRLLTATDRYIEQL